MGESEDNRADYFQSITVVEKGDVEVLNSEKVWEILEFVHQSPEGVRPQQVAEEFDLKLNQAYDKLRQLEKQSYLKRTKKRGKAGRDQERKRLLYISSPLWGWHLLDDEFHDILAKKYGGYIMEHLRPVVLQFFRQVLADMVKDPDMKNWFPAGNRDMCPDCEMKHQTIELFRALVTFVTNVVENNSYEFHQILLENGYITKRAMDDSTSKEADSYDWVFSDRPSAIQ